MRNGAGTAGPAAKLCSDDREVTRGHGCHHAGHGNAGLADGCGSGDGRGVGVAAPAASTEFHNVPYHGLASPPDVGLVPGVDVGVGLRVM